MFELREALVRQIIFAMENQNAFYAVDIERGELQRTETDLSADPIDPDAVLCGIPAWRSADGFYLMERFVGTLTERATRDPLQEILVSGNRVFRRFKDTLKEQPLLEERFFAFKFHAMRERVADWYDTLRDVHGLDRVERGVDEEIGDIQATSFAIRHMDPVPNTLVRELDRQALREMMGNGSQSLSDYLIHTVRASAPLPRDPASTVLGAYSPSDDLCGFAWIWMPHGYAGLCELLQVYVMPEFRSLGIGTALVEASIAQAAKMESLLVARMPGADHALARTLKRNGAAPLWSLWASSKF